MPMHHHQPQSPSAAAATVSPLAEVLAASEAAGGRGTTGQLYLGPARVQEAGRGLLVVELPTGRRTAQLALPVAYDARPGDTVLAIATEAGCYVIGVLAGTGKTSLKVDGDLAITAAGRLDLAAGRGIRLSSSRVAVVAEKIELAARQFLGRFAEAAQRVTGMFRQDLGGSRTRVAETSELAAGRIRQRAREDVSIDGEQVRLG